MSVVTSSTSDEQIYVSKSQTGFSALNVSTNLSNDDKLQSQQYNLIKNGPPNDQKSSSLCFWRGSMSREFSSSKECDNTIECGQIYDRDYYPSEAIATTYSSDNKSKCKKSS